MFGDSFPIHRCQFAEKTRHNLGINELFVDY